MNLSLDFGPQGYVSNPASQLPTIARYNIDTEKAPTTPRGPAYSVYDYRNGITEYDTHRKSCVSISPALQKKIPNALRKKWYFELDGAFIPLYYLYAEYRMAAEQVAAVEGESEISRYGSLSFIYKHTQEEVLAYMLKCPLAAAVYDTENGIERDPHKHWEADGRFKDDTINLYIEHLETLKHPTRRKVPELLTGVRIRFEQALYFTYEGRQLAIHEFTVKREGRLLRFLPDGYPFVARVSNLKERPYTVLS